MRGQILILMQVGNYCFNAISELGGQTFEARLHIDAMYEAILFEVCGVQHFGPYIESIYLLFSATAPISNPSHMVNSLNADYIDSFLVEDGCYLNACHNDI